jgi:hypothetical protein
MEQGGNCHRGILGFHRVEALLTNDVNFSLDTRIKAESWFGENPAHITFADQRKEATIGFFSDEPSSKARTCIGYGGYKSFQDEGWNTSGFSSIEEGFIDHYTELDYDGSTDSSISKINNVSPQYSSSPRDFVLSLRMRVNNYQLDNHNQTGLFFGVDNGDKAVFLRPTDEGLHLVNKSGTKLFNSPLGSEIWKDQEFHTYRIAVSQSTDNLSLFVDDEYQNSTVVSSLPSGSNLSEEFEFALQMENSEIDFDVDYLFAHDSHYQSSSQNQIGIYKGGNRFDFESYELVQRDWSSEFLNIRINHDNSRTEIFLNDESDPSIEMSYEELPSREERSHINTDLGFIEFGSLNPNSLSRLKWDHFAYTLENSYTDGDSLRTSQFNRFQSVTSPEPVFDEDPEVLNFTSKDSQTVYLDVANEYNIRKVIQVIDKDTGISHDFSFDSENMEISIEDRSLSGENTSVSVTFYAEEPYGREYLKNQTPHTVLYEGTPYFPLSEETEIEEGVVPQSSFNDPDSIFNDPDTTFSDGSTEIVYEVKNPSSKYKDLDVIEEDIGGKPNLLAPSYDHETFQNLEFSLYEDQYDIPDPVNPGFSNNIQTFVLDDRNSLMDDKNWAMDNLSTPQNTSEVRGEVKRVEKEVYQKATDKEPTAAMRHFEDVIILDSPGYEMDDTPKEDEYGEMDTYKTWDSTWGVEKVKRIPDSYKQKDLSYWWSIEEEDSSGNLQIMRDYSYSGNDAEKEGDDIGSLKNNYLEVNGNVVYNIPDLSEELEITVIFLARRPSSLGSSENLRWWHQHDNYTSTGGLKMENATDSDYILDVKDENDGSPNNTIFNSTSPASAHQFNVISIRMEQTSSRIYSDININNQYITDGELTTWDSSVDSIGDHFTIGGNAEISSDSTISTNIDIMEVAYFKKWLSDSERSEVEKRMEKVHTLLSF